MTDAQPWDAGRATDEIRAIARDKQLALTYKLHARERLAERKLIVTDVLHALKYGFVYQEAVPATRPGHYRYRVECRTPNSGSRAIGVIVIPAKAGRLIKIISVMWIDEYETMAGSIIGVNKDD